MMRTVSGRLVGALLLTATFWTAGYVEASGPKDGKNENESENDKKSTTVVTETETNAKLAGAGTQTAATGYAESDSVTVTDTVTNTSTTKAVLTVSVKRLTLANKSVVTFQLNGTAIGTGTVKSGRATLRLSSKKGDTVPAVNSGDTLTVVDPDGSTVDLTGAFGPAKTETEGSGK